MQPKPVTKTSPIPRPAKDPNTRPSFEPMTPNADSLPGRLPVQSSEIEENKELV